MMKNAKIIRFEEENDRGNKFYDLYSFAFVSKKELETESIMYEDSQDEFDNAVKIAYEYIDNAREYINSEYKNSPNIIAKLKSGYIEDQENKLNEFIKSIKLDEGLISLRLDEDLTYNKKIQFYFEGESTGKFANIRIMNLSNIPY